jgi:hypothetical protein
MGDKTPNYVLEIPTLLEIFPRAKVIHIYRDGRDVALSWRAIPLGPRVAGDLLSSLGYETEGIGRRAPIRAAGWKDPDSSRLFVRSLGSPQTWALMEEAAVRGRLSRSSSGS